MRVSTYSRPLRHRGIDSLSIKLVVSATPFIMLLYFTYITMVGFTKKNKINLVLKLSFYTIKPKLEPITCFFM